jgi:hypothetical protein
VNFILAEAALVLRHAPGDPNALYQAGHHCKHAKVGMTAAEITLILQPIQLSSHSQEQSDRKIEADHHTEIHRHGLERD